MGAPAQIGDDGGMRRPDLNILVILCAIYREGSVTRAAERLNLTQSAISHALGRLRAQFDDPLFLRKGNRLVSTPLARALAEAAAEGLDRLEAVFDRKASFDPGADARTFRLGVRDVLEASILPPLLASMREAAPHVSLASIHLRRSDLATRLASGAVDASIDVCVEQPPEIASERISSETFCVVARRDHPAANRGFDLETYLACEHAQISARPEGDTFEDAALRRLGRRRKVRLRCQHYLAAYRAARGSDLVATMPYRVAALLLEAEAAIALPAPEEIGRMDFHLYWHAARAHDPANLWFRQMAARAVRVGAPAAA